MLGSTPRLRTNIRGYSVVVIEFDDFRVLFTPRTGSRTLEKFLIEQGGKIVGPHHIRLNKIPPDKKLNCAVAREPLSQLGSWYRIINTHEKYSMARFLIVYGQREKFKPLNMYKSVADKVFIYERGLESMLEFLGFVVDKPLDIIGASGKTPVWAYEEELLARGFFKEDFEFYNKLLSKSPYESNV